MKIKMLLVTLTVLLVVVLACLYQLVNLAIENDGLRQVISSQSESISVLLDYSAVATKCDLQPEEIAAYLSARHPLSDFQRSTASVSGLAFVLAFQGGRPATLEIVGQRKVSLCEK